MVISLEFLFVIIGYIISTFLLFLFDVSSSNGMIYSCAFVFDKVYLFIIDNFVYNFFHSHEKWYLLLHLNPNP